MQYQQSRHRRTMRKNVKSEGQGSQFDRCAVVTHHSIRLSFINIIIFKNIFESNAHFLTLALMPVLLVLLVLLHQLQCCNYQSQSYEMPEPWSAMACNASSSASGTLGDGNSAFPFKYLVVVSAKHRQASVSSLCKQSYWVAIKSRVGAIKGDIISAFWLSISALT